MEFSSGTSALNYLQYRIVEVFLSRSGIFKSGNPAKRARAMVLAATHFNDPKKIAEVSEDLGEAMVGINSEDIVVKYADREAGNMNHQKKQ